MPLDMPIPSAPPIPERVSEITSRLASLTSTGAPTVSDDFAQLLSSQLSAQTTSGTMASLLGTDDSSSTDPTTSGTGSWMSALSGLMSQMSGTTGTSGVSGSDVVNDATQYLGVPYKWGGTNPSTGLDCSGLVQRTYADLGIQLPRTAAAQAKAGTAVDSLTDAQPGDLVAFGQPVDHIGIYAGNNTMIQAPHTGDQVKVSTIKAPVVAIRRIVGSPATGSTNGLAQWSAALSSAGSSTSTSNSAGAAQYQSLFNAAGAQYGIDPAVLSGVAKVESGYNASARSSAGAVGLMQFMPSTAAGMGFDPTDPAQSIYGAAKYLSGQMKTFGSLPLALAAYNAGAGAVKKYGGIPPYPETQNYVSKVLAAAGKTGALT